MSIGSIGSLRGALGSVDTQPSLIAPRTHVRGGATVSAAADVGSIQAGGTSGISPTAAPWAPWPPFQPLPPDQPVESKPVVSSIPLPRQAVECSGDGLTVTCMPLPEQAAIDKVDPPLPGVPRSGGGLDAPFMPHAKDGTTGVVIRPEPPPPGVPRHGGVPTVPFMPLPERQR